MKQHDDSIPPPQQRPRRRGAVKRTPWPFQTSGPTVLPAPVPPQTPPVPATSAQTLPSPASLPGDDSTPGTAEKAAIEAAAIARRAQRLS